VRVAGNSLEDFAGLFGREDRSFFKESRSMGERDVERSNAARSIAHLKIRVAAEYAFPA